MNITRLVVIDHRARGEGVVFTTGIDEHLVINYDLQDDNRTMKIFLNHDWEGFGIEDDTKFFTGIQIAALKEKLKIYEELSTEETKREVKRRTK